MAINVFGAGAVQTAYVGYKSYDLTEDTILYWPSSYLDTPNTTAAYIQIDSAGVGLTLTLPNATEVSVGQNIIISNTAANDVDLKDNSGNTLGTLSPGFTYYYILSNNSTPGGVWQQLTFGAGSADIDPIQLAGLGLEAAGAKLTTVVPPNTILGPTYTVSGVDNAGLLIWVGGSGTMTLPPVADVNDGFNFSLNNNGGGEIIISGDVPIDNQTQYAITPNQSLTFVKSTTKWYTIGYGQQASYAVSLLDLPVGGNTNITLTFSQAQRTIQQYSGVLTGNITIFFPVQISEWTLFNNTTGPFTLSVQLVGAVGDLIVIPQGETQIVYSDGSTLRIAPSAIPEGGTFPSGSASAPSITFTADTTSGMYQSAVGHTNLTAGGSEVVDMTNSDMTILKPLTLTDPIKLTSGTLGAPAYTFAADTNTGMYQSVANALDFAVDGTQVANMTSTGVSILQPLTLSSNILTSGGNVSAPAYSFTSNTNTGMYQTVANELDFAAGGIQIASITTTGMSVLQPLTLSTKLLVPGGSAAAPSVTFTSNTNSGMYQSAANRTEFSAGGVPVASMTTTGMSVLQPLTLSTPLAIANGGTNAITQPAAINNLMPAAVAGNFAYYNGTNWVTLAPAATNYRGLTMANDVPSWSGLSTLQNFYLPNSTASQQATTTTFTQVAGFTLTITLTDPANVVRVLTSVICSMSTNNGYLALYRGATLLARFGSLYSATAAQVQNKTLLYVDAPGTVGPHTYTIRVATTAAGGTLNINRDSTPVLTGFTSTFSIQELGS